MIDAARWHYQVVRHRDGNLSLCEVYFDEDGGVVEIVTNPLFAALTVAGQGRNDVVSALRNALHDARSRPILDEETLK